MAALTLVLEMRTGATPVAPALALDTDLDAPLDSALSVGWVGLVAAVALAALALALRTRRRGPLPAAGSTMAVAGLCALGLAVVEPDAVDLVGGVALAAAGAWAARAATPRAVRRQPPSLGLVVGWAVAIAPGAALAVRSLPVDDRPATLWPVVVAASVLAALVADADRSLGRSASGPPLLAASAVGIYITIPETSQILPVLVAIVPVALVGAPLALARLGGAGSAAVVVLLAAVAAAGGWSRPASIVGALAAVGVLALEPVARAIVPGARRWPDAWWSRPVLLLAGLQAVVVLLATRVAGLREDLAIGVAQAAIVMLAGLAALAALVSTLDTEVQPAEGGGRTRDPDGVADARDADEP